MGHQSPTLHSMLAPNINPFHSPPAMNPNYNVQNDPFSINNPSSSQSTFESNEYPQNNDPNINQQIQCDEVLMSDILDLENKETLNSAFNEKQIEHRIKTEIEPISISNIAATDVQKAPL